MNYKLSTHLVTDLDAKGNQIPPRPRRVLNDSYTRTMRACLRLCLEGKANEAMDLAHCRSGSQSDAQWTKLFSMIANSSSYNPSQNSSESLRAISLA